MKLNDILINEATANDADFARTAYSGGLVDKSIDKDLRFTKFLGKDEYDEFVVYEGSYDVGTIEIQTSSWVKHPETRQDPAEYDGTNEEFGVGYDGKFYYGYDSEEDQPHYWKFDGQLEVDDKVAKGMEFEGTGNTWAESIGDLISSMESYAHDTSQDIYDGY